MSNIHEALPPVSCANVADITHNLTFQVGGKLFPVDPRDFFSESLSNNASGATCVPNIANRTTDITGAKFLFSWVLGAPFLKSNVVAFYYGNLTHPSVDPPRVGLMSLVPQNASALLGDAVKEAQSAGGSFKCECLFPESPFHL